jgi:orotate phosphoribosyltransferase
VVGMNGGNAGKLRGVLPMTASPKFGAFERASGILSRYYVHKRIIPSYPEALVPKGH